MKQAPEDTVIFNLGRIVGLSPEVAWVCASKTAIQSVRLDGDAMVTMAEVECGMGATPEEAMAVYLNPETRGTMRYQKQE